MPTFIIKAPSIYTLDQPDYHLLLSKIDVILAKRLPRDEFQRIKNMVKRLGGVYDFGGVFRIPVMALTHPTAKDLIELITVDAECFIKEPGAVEKFKANLERLKPLADDFRAKLAAEVVPGVSPKKIIAISEPDYRGVMRVITTDGELVIDDPVAFERFYRILGFDRRSIEHMMYDVASFNRKFRSYLRNRGYSGFVVHG